MANFLDEHPQDWAGNPEYQELQDLLVAIAVDSGGIPFLENLAADAGITPGTFPDRDNVLTTCRDLIREMGLQGKLRALVEAARDQPTVHAGRLSELLNLPPRPPAQRLLTQQYLSDSVIVLDRGDLREQLALLASETNPLKVLLVRGAPKSGKSHGRYLFEHLARGHGAEPVYLCDGIVATVDDVVLQLFSALEASSEIPPRDTTENAWYRAVCVKLQELAASKRRPLWVTIDDLGVDGDGVPLLDAEIKAFCDQFALNMMNPAFRRWFRLMLIHYPDGPVPTKWKHEFWKEDRPNVTDIQPEHVLEFLRWWRAERATRTILDDEISSIAGNVLSQAETDEAQRLYLIHTALSVAVEQF